MKIIADENIPFLRGRLEPVAEVSYVDQFGFTPESVRDADALLIRTRTRCNADLLQGANVKLVATATIGTDQIDIPWCERNHIHVASSPGCNAPAVAQYVWSALLRLGFDPSKGERLGVVGCGNIGSIVSAWGKALGAEVVVSDPPKERKGDDSEKYLPLHELLATCKAVTFHTPLTREGEDATWHLCSSKELEMLRPGTILINAARGSVVDNAALLERMRRGDLKTAIDVWEGEPDVNRELLKSVDYGTFHIAGYSRQGKERATRMVLEAVEREFGVTVDKSGLEGPHGGATAKAPSAATILSSYDPKADSEPLKKSPEAFDKLRHDYHYREECKSPSHKKC